MFMDDYIRLLTDINSFCNTHSGGRDCDSCNPYVRKICDRIEGLEGDTVWLGAESVEAYIENGNINKGSRLTAAQAHSIEAELMEEFCKRLTDWTRAVNAPGSASNNTNTTHDIDRVPVAELTTDMLEYKTSHLNKCKEAIDLHINNSESSDWDNLKDYMDGLDSLDRNVLFKAISIWCSNFENCEACSVDNGPGCYRVYDFCNKLYDETDYEWREEYEGGDLENDT